MTIHVVVDTSSLVSPPSRRALQQAAQLGACTVVWLPWIIAELNRVLVWLWTARHGGDRSRAGQKRCSAAAKAMMEILLPTFELVAPLPPYPPVWETLQDAWDHPIWAAAKIGRAEYVISENHHDYPPATEAGRHVHEGIEYLSADAFLAVLSRSPGRSG